jgi:hypothetical protein
MEFEGQEAVTYLTGWNTIRDGSLVAMHLQNADTEPVINLTFHVERDGAVRIVELELCGVQDFNYQYFSDGPVEISHMKCLWTSEGQFFLSLDPYDERELFISERDNDFFRSKSVKLRTDGATSIE